MNQDLAAARFWVRPFEFEGDGSTGAAADVASLEVGGKTRMFWLKTLHNRLFFREIGRDESWNFGALEALSEPEKSDLPLALAHVLASDNYGRVLLPDSPPMPCYLLNAPDGRVRCGVPRSALHAFFERKHPHTMWNNHFLDWRPGAFKVIGTSHSLHCNAPEFVEKLDDIPVPSIGARWERGSQQEWRDVLQAFFFRQWPYLRRFGDANFAVQWRYQGEWAMGNSFFRYHRVDLSSAIAWMNDCELEKPEARRLRFIQNQFCFGGQEENGYGGCKPLWLNGTIHAPTHHEILEAHLYLRDWIGQRLPLERARQWLDFSM